MTLPIILHPAAAREVRAAWQYYNDVQPELGEVFLSELDTLMERTQRLPMSGRAWRRTDPGRRVYVLRRFPYLVVARVLETELRVLAVAHQRRRPGYWLKRE